MRNHSESFWTILYGPGPYWIIMNHFDSFWIILNDFESYDNSKISSQLLTMIFNRSKSKSESKIRFNIESKLKQLIKSNMTQKWREMIMIDHDFI